MLMHDASLERTTTGTGLVNKYTLEELLTLRLKDPSGRETPYRLSTLEEAIAWSQGKTILVIDYISLVQNGADLIETDIPTLLGPLLRSNAAIPSDKTPYSCHP